MGVDNIKNPAKYFVHEIGIWLENHGYGYSHIFVVNAVCISLHLKISPQDQEAFENDWGCEVRLEGASFGADGHKNKFKYRCSPKELVEFKSYLNSWLRNNNFPINYTMVTESISLNTSEKLLDAKISDFEKEFGVKCKGYSISCNSNRIEYKFA